MTKRSKRARLEEAVRQGQKQANEHPESVLWPPSYDDLLDLHAHNTQVKLSHAYDDAVHAVRPAATPGLAHTPAARESFTHAVISPTRALGRQRDPFTSTRIRPSDEEDW